MNGRFRDDTAFVKAQRHGLCAGPSLTGRPTVRPEDREPTKRHFVTFHDASPYDLVSYNTKQHEANVTNNTDGHSRPEVALRRRGPSGIGCHLCISQVTNSCPAMRSVGPLCGCW